MEIFYRFDLVTLKHEMRQGRISVHPSGFAVSVNDHPEHPNFTSIQTALSTAKRQRSYNIYIGKLCSLFSGTSDLTIFKGLLTRAGNLGLSDPFHDGTGISYVSGHLSKEMEDYYYGPPANEDPNIGDPSLRHGILKTGGNVGYVNEFHLLQRVQKGTIFKTEEIAPTDRFTFIDDHDIDKRGAIITLILTTYQLQIDLSRTNTHINRTMKIIAGQKNLVHCLKQEVFTVPPLSSLDIIAYEDINSMIEYLQLRQHTVSSQLLLRKEKKQLRRSYALKKRLLLKRDRLYQTYLSIYASLRSLVTAGYSLNWDVDFLFTSLGISKEDILRKKGKQFAASVDAKE
jgi:hypothetical protein